MNFFQCECVPCSPGHSLILGSPLRTLGEARLLLLLGVFGLRLAGLSGSRVETPVSFPGAPGSCAVGSSAERG